MAAVIVLVAVGFVVFAAVADAVARRRGTYRGPEFWNAARTARRARRRRLPRGPFGHGGR